MNVLLDTCTFLWVCAGAPDLAASARRTFSDPGNEIYLSAVSAWEIAVKHAIGKLPLPDPPDRFVPHQRALHAIHALPLDEAAVLQLGKLPRLHRDPFDRMLVCQAVAHGMVLLTPDPLIEQYPIRTQW